MEFNPDLYLQEKAQGFTPDAYLRQKISRIPVNATSTMMRKIYAPEIEQGRAARERVAIITGIPETELIRNEVRRAKEGAYGLPVRQKATELGYDGVMPIPPGNMDLSRKPIYESIEKLIKEDPSILDRL